MNISVTNLWTESDKDGLVEYPNKAESVMIQVLRLLYKTWSGEVYPRLLKIQRKIVQPWPDMREICGRNFDHVIGTLHRG